MAVPAMTANSPSNGSIAWAGFTIQYQGVGYGIAAGSTGERFVWWRFNSGGTTTVIEAGPNIPQDLRDDDLVLFGNKNGIPLRMQATSLVDGDLLVDGSIVNKSIATDAVAARHIGAGEIYGVHVGGDIATFGEFYSREGVHVGSADGPGLEMTTQRGFIQRGFDSLGNLIEKVRFPVNADEDNVIRGRMFIEWASIFRGVFYGAQNLIARDAVLRLAASIEAPGLPLVQVYYPRVERGGSDPGLFGNRLQDVYWESRSGNVDRYQAMRWSGSTQNRIQFEIDRSTGQAQFVPLTTPDRFQSYPGGSHAFIGDITWSMHAGNQRLYWRRRNNENGEFSRPNAGHAQGIYSFDAKLYFWRQSDGNIASNSKIEIWEINQSTGALTAVETFMVHTGDVRQIVSHMRRGRFGTGSAQYLLVMGSGPARRIVRLGTGGFSFPVAIDLLADQYAFWAGPESDAAAGLFAGGGFNDSSSPLAVQYNLAMRNDLHGPVDFYTTWARGDDRTLETEASPRARVQVPLGSSVQVDPGEWPAVSDPPAETDVDRVVLYLQAANSSGWTRLAPHASRTTPIPVPLIARSSNTAPAPPSASTFPAELGEPGAIASAVGGLVLLGNGKAEVARTPVDAVDVTNKAYVDRVAATRVVSPAVVSPFTGSVVATRRGDTVTVSVGASRGSGSSTAWTTVATLPVGWRPGGDLATPPSPWFNSTANYQIAVFTNGQVAIRMSAANSGGMAGNPIYETPDIYPS